MPTVVPIDDPDDERLSPYRHLTDAALRHDLEHGSQIFIVEGITAIGRLLASDFAIRSLLVTPSRLGRLEPELAGRDVTVFVAGQTVMDAIAGFAIHRGAVAVAARPRPREAADLLRESRTVAIAEGLNDHENLGAIARSAVALGVDALLLSPGCADPYYRRAVRVSMGELLFLPCAVLQPWPDALHCVVRSAGFRVVALTPSGDDTIDDIRVGEDDRVAVLLGAEGPGLTDAALALADDRVRIAMRTGSDSLNVGHAAAIAFHRLGRAATASLRTR